MVTHTREEKNTQGERRSITGGTTGHETGGTIAPGGSQRVAVVTGAGRGIGAATARLLASQGHRVVLVSRTEQELYAVAEQIEKQQGPQTAWAFRADVSREAEVKMLFESVEKAWGPVQVLINNAGVIARIPFEEYPLEEFDRLWAINVRGAFLCAQQLFIQLRRAQKPGCIVNVSSLGGIRSTQKFPGFSAYVASKHALVGLTESLSVEGKPLGIRVNCVAPGAVDTKMLQEAVPFLKTKTAPEDVAEVIAMLCDERRARALTGAVIEIHSNE